MPLPGLDSGRYAGREFKGSKLAQILNLGFHRIGAQREMTTNNDERLRALGWGPWQERALCSVLHAGEEPARVVRQEGTGLWLEAGGDAFAAVLSGRFKHSAASSLELPVVGDWVLFSKRDTGGSDLSVVQGILPRSTALVRRRAGPRADSQLMGANIDLALVVWGLDRPPNVRLLERACAMAVAAGIQPALVLTKLDACSEWATHVDGLRLRLAQPVFAVSVFSGQGLEQLASEIRPGRTAALIGPSGAGKSSLANHLLGSVAMRVGSVRGSDQKGRHTTTHRQLFHMPGAGLILDGPGIREFGLVGEPSESGPKWRRGDLRGNARGGRNQ